MTILHACKTGNIDWIQDYYYNSEEGGISSHGSVILRVAAACGQTNIVNWMILQPGINALDIESSIRLSEKHQDTTELLKNARKLLKSEISLEQIRAYPCLLQLVKSLSENETDTLFPTALRASHVYTTCMS